MGGGGLTDSYDYAAASNRLLRNTLWIGVAGTVGLAAFAGWRNGLGFAAGAAVAWHSVYSFRRLLESVTPGPQASREAAKGVAEERNDVQRAADSAGTASAQTVSSAAEEPAPGIEYPREATARHHIFRYVFLGLGVYAILGYLDPHPFALLGGFLAAAAAVVLEFFYQILYART